MQGIFGRNAAGFGSALLSIRYTTLNTATTATALGIGASLYYITVWKNGSYYYLTLQPLAVSGNILDNSVQPTVTVARNGTTAAQIVITPSTTTDGLSRGLSYSLNPLNC